MYTNKSIIIIFFLIFLIDGCGVESNCFVDSCADGIFCDREGRCVENPGSLLNLSAQDFCPPSTDLFELLSFCPSEAEMSKYDFDFGFVWLNCNDKSYIAFPKCDNIDESWKQNHPYACAEKEDSLLVASKMAVFPYMLIRTLNCLEFTRPFPEQFTGGLSLYDFMAKVIHRTELHLGNDVNGESMMAYSKKGSGTIGFARDTLNLACFRSDCDKTQAVMFMINGLSTLLHEANHAAGGPLHTDNTFAQDKNISVNGAYAAELYFYLWVYRYANGIDEEIRLQAKKMAGNKIKYNFADPCQNLQDQEILSFMLEINFSDCFSASD